MKNETFVYPIIDMEKTGERIKILCEINHLDPVKLAKFFGVTKQSVFYWFKGVNLPSMEHMKALSILFEIPIEDIIVLKNYKK